MNPEAFFAVLPPGPRSALAFAVQAALLFYPAWRLAGGDPARFPVAVGLVLTVSALPCWLLDAYTWPVAATIPACLCLFFISLKLLNISGIANRSPGLDPLPPLPGPWLAAGISAILFGGLLLNLRAPLTGWDAMTYHIEFPSQWIQAGRFEWGITGYGDESPPYYPGLSALWFGWWLLGGSGAYGLVDATGIFWWLALWGGIRALLYLRADARVRPALTEGVAVWIAGVPYFTSATLTAENDLMLATGFVLAWRSFELMRLRGLSPVTATEGGLACGFLAAVKFTALPFLGALLLLYGSWAALSRARHVGHALPLLVPATLALLAGGGWWYLRNLYYTGNPLYPGEIRIPFFNIIICEGYSTAAFFAAHPFHAFAPRDLLTDPAYGPALLGAVGLTLLSGRPWRGRLGPLALPALVVAAFWFFVPLRLPRLLGPLALALGPALLAGLLGLSSKPGGKRMALSVILAACAMNMALFAARLAELYGDPFAIQISLTDFTRATLRFGAANLASFAACGLYLLLCFIVALVGARCLRLLTGHRIQRAVAFLAFCGASFLIDAGDFGAYERRAGAQGRAWAFLDRMRAGAPATPRTGLVGSNALTPLRGPNGDRPLVLILSRPEEDSPLFARTWGRQHGAVVRRPGPERELFERQLARHKIDILFVTKETGSAPPRWHAEREWTRALNWRLLFADEGVEIYTQYRSRPGTNANRKSQQDQSERDAGHNAPERGAPAVVF